MEVFSDSDFQIHIQRKPNACFVNNYFVRGLLAWKTNIDIQLVFNHYKAVSYMYTCFSKAENRTSEAMKQTGKEALISSKSDYEKIKATAKAYTEKGKCSVQEEVYLVMPELWLRRIFPRVLFLNSNLSDKRYKSGIEELPIDSTDLFERNMLDRYLDRRNESFKNGKYKMIDKLWFADFLSLYYFKSKSVENENYCPPVVFDDKLMELIHSESKYPKIIQLITWKEKLKYRKFKAVLRCHLPSTHKFVE